MTQATAVEFQREFGKFRTIAQREPVVVTNHGRPDLVVLSAQEYDRLKLRDRQVILSSELTDEEIRLLDAQVIPEHTRAFNHEVD